VFAQRVDCFEEPTVKISTHISLFVTPPYQFWSVFNACLDCQADNLKLVFVLLFLWALWLLQKLHNCGNDGAIWGKNTTGGTHEATLWSCSLKLEGNMRAADILNFDCTGYLFPWFICNKMLKKCISVSVFVRTLLHFNTGESGTIVRL
jgi:hypothetical protein